MKKIGTLATLLSALVLSGLTLAAPSPAAADSGDLTFETGGGKVAAIDLAGLHAASGDRRVVLVLHVRDLTDRGRFHFYQVENSPEAVYGLEIEVRKGRDGQVVDRFREFGDGWSEARACTSSKVRWDKGRDLIRLSYRQSCFHAELPDVWQYGTFSRLRYSTEDRSELDNPRKHLVLQRG